MSGKYVPPHLRKKANNNSATRKNNKKSEPNTRSWLEKHQTLAPTSQTASKAKNMNSMTYKELKNAAGTPPALIGFTLFNDHDFKKDIEKFKKGDAPPPHPRLIQNDILQVTSSKNGSLMYYEGTFGRELDRRTDSVNAYKAWWNKYGKLLDEKWDEEHGVRRARKKSKSPPRAATTTRKASKSPPKKREILPAANASGW